jgi:hypothetical protein
MLLLETSIFYLLFGLTVAIAVYLRGGGETRVGKALQLMAVCAFWPLFLPTFLATGDSHNTATRQAVPKGIEDEDALSAAIGQVEKELDAALNGLDGWAEDVLNSEQHRLAELRTAWKAQADRIRELDRLLATPEARIDSLAEMGAEVERARESENLRQGNIRQLVALRNQMHADLVGTLAWVRELVTMIHLAKFSGAPAARAEELVAQIAAAVQGLSEVSAWREQEEMAVH